VLPKFTFFVYGKNNNQQTKKVTDLLLDSKLVKDKRFRLSHVCRQDKTKSFDNESSAIENLSLWFG
jgi:hypothetical protein